MPLFSMLTNTLSSCLKKKSLSMAFGRGEGVSVFFKGDSSNNAMFPINCTIRNNTALWGAGLLIIECQDNYG